jgi:hypothetical protein
MKQTKAGKHLFGRPRWIPGWAAAGLLSLGVLAAREAPVRGGPPPQTPVSSGALQIIFEPESGKVTALTNLLTGIGWLPGPSPLYRMSADSRLKRSLACRPLPEGEIELRLKISNPSAQRLTAQFTFPLVEGLRPGGADSSNPLAYCFPQKGIVAETKAARMLRPYSSEFPLQFMDVYAEGKGGVYVMTRETTNRPRRYFLNKTDRVSLGVYNAQPLEPGETLTLAAVIGAHRGDWHEALLAYRRWVQTWHKPEAPRKPWFQEVFNFRQTFLHPNRQIQTAGTFDSTTRGYSLEQALQADSQAFGGVDFVHLFDWGLDPKRGRVGDYDPWEFLGGAARFREQIARVRAKGIPVGLYVEGYLVARKSDVFKANGNAWQLLNSKGQPYSQFGPGYLYACPCVEGWREHLKHVCIEAVRQSGADGVYIDEFGFGHQYACYNPAHHHPLPSAQVQAEGELLRELRRALPATAVTYTEETGTDVTSQYQDGAFTYSVSRCRNENNPARLNLFRFALPDYKLFEILRVDAPLGDDPEAVKNVFFNGEGIWLEGPLNERWFPASVCRTIARTHRLLRQYRDAFCSLEPIPLVPTLARGVYANEFPARNRVVWTLYNAGAERARGELLKVRHAPGAHYFDAWNETPLAARIAEHEAFLALAIEPHDVGCIVQEFKPTQ